MPGSRGFADVRGLFGGAASHLVAAGARVVPVADALGDRAVLIALAATAFHARAKSAPGGGDLIVGHGVLGRLLARLAVLGGGVAPTVWEREAARGAGAAGYQVLHPDADTRRDYQTIYDVSGDASLLDTLIGRLAPSGEIVLAGFYDKPLSFAFPSAFMREARLRVAAEWKPDDLTGVTALIASGALSLDGLITHRAPAGEAGRAYATAFDGTACLKMVLDWSGCS